MKALTYRHFPNSRLSVQNTGSGHVEFIYELKKFHQNTADGYLKSLYGLQGIECANFILEEDKASV